MYGYYRSGRRVNGVKSIPFVHLIEDDGKSPVCGADQEMTYSEFSLGKKICRGCTQVVKRRKRKEEKAEKRAWIIEHTASMF